MFADDKFIYREKPYVDYGYLNLAYCLNDRDKLRDKWLKRPNTWVFVIDCKYPGYEVQFGVPEK